MLGGVPELAAFSLPDRIVCQHDITPMGKVHVDNLVVIVDYNHIQLDGFVADIMPLDPLAEKWRSFNWHVIEVDGHSIPELQSAFAEAQATKIKPTAIIAHTIKGKGVSFMENNPKFHGTAPTADELKLALQELQ